MKKLILFFLLLNINLIAQDKNCASSIRLEKFLAENPISIEKRNQLENEINSFIYSNKSNATIPVVVHIVYKNSFENISDAQIHSQIDVLNKDYTRTNSDIINTPSDFIPIVSDMQLNFCLATQDPNGNPTNGIIRKYTNKSSFDLYSDSIFYDSLGGSTAWNTKKYLNIWVCNINNEYIGWGQFPSGGNINTDGVVINFEHFGTTGTALPPYNLGRTTTHEIGHWFNLFHLWGDNLCGNDYVNDTPEQEQANYGCKNHPFVSCGNNGDMFMNFMDYTNDECMNSFTEGQKNRVWATINNYRLGLLTSDGCNSISLGNSDIGILKILNPIENDSLCSSSIYPKIIIQNLGNTPISSFIIKYSINNGSQLEQSWSGYLNPGEIDTVLIFEIQSELYLNTLKIILESPNNSLDINSLNNEATTDFFIKNADEIEMILSTDNYAYENSWILLDDQNNLIDSSSSLLNNTVYSNQYCLSSGCYKLIINDSYGDGFCCDFGNGFLRLISEKNDSIIGYINEFAFTDTVSFCINSSTDINYVNSLDVEIYPNPSNGIFYISKQNNPTNKFIFAEFINYLGQRVLNIKLDQNNIINAKKLPSGMYILNLSTINKILSKKVIIQNEHYE